MRARNIASLCAAAAIFVAAGCTGPNPAYTAVTSDGHVAKDAAGRGASPDAGQPEAPGPTLDAGGAGAPDDAVAGTDTAAPGDAGTSDGAVAGTDAAAPRDVGAANDGGSADTAARPDPNPDLAPAPDMAPPPFLDWPPAGSKNSFSFESSVEGWVDLRWDHYHVSEIFPTTSTAHPWHGNRSLAVPLDTRSWKDTYKPTIGIRRASFGASPPANTLITYQIWVPEGTQLHYAQPYVFYHQPGHADNDLSWGSDSEVYLAKDCPAQFPKCLPHAQWTTITVRVPGDVDSRGVEEVGIEWETDGVQNFTVYVDGVSW